MLAFAGIGSEVQGLYNNLHHYYDETNVDDAYAIGSNFNESVVKDFQDMDSTTELKDSSL